MSTKKLLKGLKWIQDDLAKNGPSRHVEAAIARMRGIAKIYKAQLEYEKTKAEYPNANLKLFEPFASVNGKDRKNLDDAVASNRQIRKRLRELKMAKAFR